MKSSQFEAHPMFTRVYSIHNPKSVELSQKSCVPKQDRAARRTMDNKSYYKDYSQINKLYYKISQWLKSKWNKTY